MPRVAAVVAVGCAMAWVTSGQPIAIVGVSPAFLAGGGYRVEGGTVVVSHVAGFSLFSRPPFEDPNNLAQLHLLGKRMSFAVDLSRVGCACNLAVYLISMPARDWEGRPSPGENRGGQPPYYCDANQVGGQWCPEIDLMEANSRAFAATPHRCDAPNNGHYENCDRGGCGQNTRDRPNAYGPGAGFTIDTARPFEVHTDFVVDEGSSKLAGMRTTLSQEGRDVVLQGGCDPWYLEQLSEALSSGMSLRMSYWGEQASSMSWLDSPPCGGEPCSPGEAVIANFRVLPLGATSPADWASVLRRNDDEPRLGEDAFGNTMAAGALSGVAFGILSATLVLAVLAVAQGGRARRRDVEARQEEGIQIPANYTSLEFSASSPAGRLHRRPASSGAGDLEEFEPSPGKRRMAMIPKNL